MTLLHLCQMYSKAKYFIFCFYSITNYYNNRDQSQGGKTSLIPWIRCHKNIQIKVYIRSLFHFEMKSGKKSVKGISLFLHGIFIHYLRHTNIRVSEIFRYFYFIKITTVSNNSRNRGEGN